MSKNTFDDGSVGRIARAVRAIERLGGDRAEPPVYYETDTSATFRQVIRGTFSGVWAKGATAEVAFTADNGDTATRTAINYCVNAGSEGDDSACVIALAGGEWVLIETASANGAALTVGKTTAAWTKGTESTIDVWDGDPLANTGRTITAKNLFADIGSGKFVGVISGYLVAAEC